MSINSTASSAERPAPRRTAACALSPLKLYSTDTRAFDVLSPQFDLHVRADVGEDRDVDVLERARLHVVRLRAVQFLRHAGPEPERALTDAAAP